MHGNRKDILLNNPLYNFRFNKYIVVIFRIVIGLMFIYASLNKIINPGDFAEVVRSYEIAPELLSNSIAIILPWLEFWCGLFLILGIFIRSSAAVLGFLLVFFIFALISVILRGLEIDCGCFATSTEVSWSRVIEDIVYLILTVYIFFQFDNSYSIEKVITHPKPLPESSERPGEGYNDSEQTKK